MSSTLSGGCLCGAVRYETADEPKIVGHCHCVDCRKSSGTGHCTHVGTVMDALKVIGDLHFYERDADSGNNVRRGFCPNCGCAVYSTNSGYPGMAFIRASSLDDPDAIVPNVRVYASRAPSWDHMDSTLPSFDEMPPADVSAAAGASNSQV